MSTLLKPEVRQVDEVVGDAPGEVNEVLAASQDAPAGDAAVPSSKHGASPPPLSSSDLVAEAHEIAERLFGCLDLSERIEVYKEVGQRYKSEWRRVLNIAAARWPHLMPMVNDEVEWKALLSADLS